MAKTCSKALVFCVNQKALPFALLCAQRALLLSEERDFDVVIVGQDRLEMPERFTHMGIQLVHMDLAPMMAQHNLDTDVLPADAYTRLWLAQRLGHRYHRILYLDYDTLVLTPDLGRLMDLDLGPHPFGAILDSEQWRCLGKPVLDYKNLDLPVTRYFNSGVMLIDTQRFNESRMLERSLEVARDADKLEFHDQSLLNIATYGQFAELHPVWNWQWARFRPFYQDFVGAEIFHFTGQAKPWRAEHYQDRFPASLVGEYHSFLRLHFPDIAPRQFERHKSSGRYKEILYELINHVEDMWGLRRYIRRFEDKFDVLI